MLWVNIWRINHVPKSKKRNLLSLPTSTSLASTHLTESSTQELIQQFSGTTYKIELETALDRSRTIALETIGVAVEQEKIIYVNQPELLYKVFDILKPLPLQCVLKDRSNLTEIFLQIVREGRNERG